MNSSPPPGSPKLPSDLRRTETTASSLAPEALAGLGKLRECVAAAKNLEHLIASRDVGPKMLGQIVPDVAAELEPFSQTVAEVYNLIQSRLDLPRDCLLGLVESAQATSGRLIETLRAESRPTFNAKRRLAVERNLRSSLPPLASALSQIELLVEATSSTGVTMSITELLQSSPDSSSNRPRRSIIVLGHGDECFVSISARVGLTCLGMIASALEASGRPCSALQVSTDTNRHLLSFVEPLAQEQSGKPGTAQIPIYRHTEHSLATVAAALRPFSGTLEQEHSKVGFPVA